MQLLEQHQYQGSYAATSSTGVGPTDAPDGHTPPRADTTVPGSGTTYTISTENAAANNAE